MEVAAIIGVAQEVAGNAIAEKRKLGAELGRSDLPDHDEVDSVIREVPQFETAGVTAALPSELWKLLGTGVTRSLVRKNLRENYGKQLESELEAYAHGVRQWARSLGRTLQRSINAYLDVFRGVLQSSALSFEDGTVPQQLRDDVEKLREEASSTAEAFAVQGE